MGLHIGLSSCMRGACDRNCGCRTEVPKKIENPNPDPKKFRIENLVNFGRFQAMFVNYPNCTNYEGNKILVTENLDFTNCKELDPHFCEKHPFVVARFEPTDRGWQLAKALAESLNG